MPTKTTWTDPEVFLHYGNVTVYHTYRDDDVDQGVNWYHFTLIEFEDGHEFDIRDLDLPSDVMAKLNPNIPFLTLSDARYAAATPDERQAFGEAWSDWYDSGVDEAKKYVLREAIRRGVLQPREKP